MYTRARSAGAGRAVVELGAVPGGYAWVFPKGDHVNVGVGGWESEGPRLREHLERACAAYELPAERLEALRGYRLPMRRPGDAAGSAGVCCSSATRPGSSTRSPATGSTRRSSARASRPRRRSTCSAGGRRASRSTGRGSTRRSAARWPRRGRRSWRSSDSRGWSTGSRGCRSSGASRPRSCAAIWRIPDEARGLVRAPLRLVETLGPLSALTRSQAGRGGCRSAPSWT